MRKADRQMMVSVFVLWALGHSAAVGAIFSDDFTRADGTTAGFAAEPNWASIVREAGTSFRINNNTLYTPSYGTAMATPPFNLGKNFRLEYDWVQTRDAGVQGLSTDTSMTNTSTGLNIAFFSGAGGRFLVRGYNASSNLATIAETYMPFSSGQTAHIRWERNGDLLRLVVSVPSVTNDTGWIDMTTKFPAGQVPNTAVHNAVWSISQAADYRIDNVVISVPPKGTVVTVR